MKHYLHLIDYVGWTTVIVAQLALCFEAIRRRVAIDNPCFVIYLAFLSLESLVLLFISTFLSYKVYFYSYYSADVIEMLLLLFVAYEVFLRVFEPLRALPAHTVARIVCLLITVGALVITTIISSGHEQLGEIWSAIQRFRIAVKFVVCFSFWLLVVYAWLLKLAWWSRVAHIASGFLLYLTGHSLLYVLVLHASEPYRPLLARLKTFVFLATLCFWFVAIRTKQLSFGQASLEDLLKLRTFVDEMRLAALRLRNLPKRERPNEQ